MNKPSERKPNYLEIVTYDLPGFPIYIRDGRLSLYENYSAISHWHDDIELIYILSGTMQYDVNGEIVNLLSGEGILVNSRQFHFGFSREKTECTFMCILFHPSLLSSSEYVENHYVKPLIDCESLPYLHLTPEIIWHKGILDSIVKIYSLEKNTPAFALSCQRYLFELFALWYQNVTVTREETNKADTPLNQLRAMVSFIQAHYTDSITLNDITKTGAMGKTCCCNLFKKYIHMTPIEYLVSYRLQQSVRLILSTDLPITEISFEVGFHNASYYTKIFRQSYGKTPTEFRKEAHFPISFL